MGAQAAPWVGRTRLRYGRAHFRLGLVRFRVMAAADVIAPADVASASQGMKRELEEAQSPAAKAAKVEPTLPVKESERSNKTDKEKSEKKEKKEKEEKKAMSPAKAKANDNSMFDQRRNF